MRYKMTKKWNLSSPHSFFEAQNAPKPVFGRGSAEEAYDAPPDPRVGWGGGYPLPAQRLRRLELGARLGSQAPLKTKSWLYASVGIVRRSTGQNKLR